MRTPRVQLSIVMGSRRNHCSEKGTAPKINLSRQAIRDFDQCSINLLLLSHIHRCKNELVKQDLVLQDTVFKYHIRVVLDYFCWHICLDFAAQSIPGQEEHT